MRRTPCPTPPGGFTLEQFYYPDVDRMQAMMRRVAPQHHSAGTTHPCSTSASTSWGQEEIDAMHRVIDSGMFTMGASVRLLEEQSARKFGVKHALMVSSGSTANLVGVASLFFKKDRPLQRGDEVIVPAISWSTTYYPLQQYGLRLRFVDVDLQTLNLDVAQLEAALTPRTRMLVAVSILGNPCALDVMRAFCDRHRLYFFEDNWVDGATLNGGPVTFGDIGTFSSFFSHHLHMEGGILVTGDTEIYHLARSIGRTAEPAAGHGHLRRRDDDFLEPIASPCLAMRARWNSRARSAWSNSRNSTA